MRVDGAPRQGDLSEPDGARARPDFAVGGVRHGEDDRAREAPRRGVRGPRDPKVRNALVGSAAHACQG